MWIVYFSLRVLSMIFCFTANVRKTKLALSPHQIKGVLQRFWMIGWEKLKLIFFAIFQRIQPFFEESRLAGDKSAPTRFVFSALGLGFRLSLKTLLRAKKLYGNATKSKDSFKKAVTSFSLLPFFLFCKCFLFSYSFVLSVTKLTNSRKALLHFLCSCLGCE